MNHLINMSEEIHVILDPTMQSVSFIQNGVKLDPRAVFALLYGGLWTIFYKTEHIQVAAPSENPRFFPWDSPGPIYQTVESIRIVPVAR